MRATVARRRSAGIERAELERLLDGYAGDGRRRSCATSAGTTSRDVLGRAPAGARDDRPADGDLRVHDQGLRARDRRAAAEPLRAPRRRRRSTASARRSGLTPETEWDAIRAPTRREGALLAERAPRASTAATAAAAAIVERAGRRSPTRDPAHDVDAGGVRAHAARPLARRGRRRAPRHGRARTSPSSTNLGGFINKTGVWGPDEEPVYDAMEDSPLKWRVGPRGQHIEMGIAEMNLVLLLGQLGLSWDFQRERLFPIGTLYDPFVMRALEGIVYSTYSGLALRPRRARRPGSRSRARAAPTSRSRPPGSGSRRPGSRMPSRATRASSSGCSSTRSRACRHPEGEALYLRLSTTPIDQAPFAAAVEPARRGAAARGRRRRRLPAARAGRERRPRAARTLRRDRPRGARGGERCSPRRRGSRRPCSASRRRTGSTATGRRAALRRCEASRSRPRTSRALLTPDERGLPVVTVIDGASHALSFVGSALGVRCVPLGVDRFGQTGSQPEVYAEYGIDAGVDRNGGARGARARFLSCRSHGSGPRRRRRLGRAPPTALSTLARCSFRPPRSRSSS